MCAAKVTQLFDLACDASQTYLVGYNMETAAPQKGRVRRSISARALMVLSHYAEETGTTVGQVADHLLRQFLPLVLLDKNTRAQVDRKRIIVQVHPMVLTRFHEVRAADETGAALPVKDYLWFLAKELTDDHLVHLIDTAASLWRNYQFPQYTSMECPSRVYSFITEGAEVYRVPKTALFSSFIIELLRWYRTLESYSTLEFPEPDDAQLPYNDEALAELLRYSFTLGMRRSDRC